MVAAVSDATKPLVNATNLGVMRGDRVLFKALSLTAVAGECILLRGANGAGKTTLLRTLAGFVRPDAGEVTSEAFHWLGHKTGLKPHESPTRHLKVWARAWGSEAEITPILDRLGLKRCADVPATGLSAGQKRRTGFARLLMAERPIWFLDEPFSALDTAGKALISEIASEHVFRGGAIVAAVHGEVPLQGREVQL